MIKSLSIIFPIYNEELRLNSSFKHILTFIKKQKKIKIQIIFVDDGSEDGTWKLINKFINNFKKNKKINIQAIKSKKNLGKGSALKLGVKKAKYDWILTADIDMSVSLFQIINWSKKKFINKKNIVYFGSRTHKKSMVKRKFFRILLGVIMRFLIFFILKIKMKDTQCGYKLYKKPIAKLIFSQLKNYGFDHDLEIVLFLKSKKIKIMELPVNWIHKNNSRLNIFLDPIKMFFGILLIRYHQFKS